MEPHSDKKLNLNQLRETLDESGRTKQMEKQRTVSQNMREIYQQVPLYIYTG